MYHENMAWELQPKKKKLPVKRMRIVVVIERMELETGYTRVGKG